MINDSKHAITERRDRRISANRSGMARIGLLKNRLPQDVFDPLRVDVTLVDHVLRVLRKEDRFICHGAVSGPVSEKGAPRAPLSHAADGAGQVM